MSNSKWSTWQQSNQKTPTVLEVATIVKEVQPDIEVVVEPTTLEVPTIEIQTKTLKNNTKVTTKKNDNPA